MWMWMWNARTTIDPRAACHFRRRTKARADDAAERGWWEERPCATRPDDHYAQFDPAFAFGVDRRTKPGSGLAFLDDDAVIFPVGCQLAVSRTDTHVMSFFPLLDNVRAINGVATRCNPNDPAAAVVAVAEEVELVPSSSGGGNAERKQTERERGGAAAAIEAATGGGAPKRTSVVHQVSVYRYHTKRRVRAFRVEDTLTRGEVVGMSFTKDAQHIAVQYGDSVSFGSAHDPDYIAAYYSLATGKMLGWLKNDAKVTSIGISPASDDLLATTGPRWLRIWRLFTSKDPRAAATFKPVVVTNYDVRRDLPADVKLTCHAWLGASTRDKSMDRLALATTSGEILVLSSRVTIETAAVNQSAAKGADDAGIQSRGREGRNVVFVNTLRIPLSEGFRSISPPRLVVGEGAVIPDYVNLWPTTEEAAGDDEGASSNPGNPGIPRGSNGTWSNGGKVSEEEASRLQVAREAALVRVTSIQPTPTGFLAATAASVMAVFEEDHGESTGGAEGVSSNPGDGAAVDGAEVATVGGYAPTRFLPLAEGCGGEVKSIALSTGGKQVAAVCEVGPVALLRSLTGSDADGAEDLDGDGVDDHTFAALSGGCHVAPVTSVDVGFGVGGYPLAVTGSADRTVRLWHLDERRCIAVHQNHKFDICCVSLHPSAAIVAVSDENGLKLCDVCDADLSPADWSYDAVQMDRNGLRLRAVLPAKSSRAMRFSHGGAYLAASSRNVVHVYHVWTRTLVATLRNHARVVTAVSWAPDDSRLNTGCSGGTLNVYRMHVDLGDDPEENGRRRKGRRKTQQQEEYEETMKRIGKHLEEHAKDESSDNDAASSDDEAADPGGTAGQQGQQGSAPGIAERMHLKSIGYTVKACKIAGVAQLGPRPGSLRYAEGDRGVGAVATCGSDGVLRMIRGGAVDDEANVGVQITAVETSLCGTHVFVGLVDGAIQTREVVDVDPEDVDTFGGAVVRFNGHTRDLRLPRTGTAITCMRLSPDGASLLCGTSSGAVFIAQVSIVINGLIHEPSVIPPQAQSAKPLLMVPLEDIRDRNNAIAQLEEKVADQIKSSQFRMMMLESENEEKLAAARQRVDEAVAEKENALREMDVARAKMTENHKENRAQLEATHLLAAEELEASYERRLALEAERFKQLQEEVTDYRLATEEKVAALHAEHEAAMAGAEKAAREALRAAEARAEKLGARAKEDAENAAALLKETEDVDFADLDAANMALNQSKRDFHHFRNRLIGERNLLNQKVKVNRDLVEAERVLKDEQAARVAQRDDVIKSMENTIDALKRDLRERTDLMAARDAELASFKRKMHDLELVGYVMTYKHDELEKKSMPVVAEVKALKEQVALNDAAMTEKIQELNAARVQKSKDGDRILGLQRELAEMRDEVHLAETKFRRFCDDFSTALTFVDHERDEALLRLNEVYIKESVEGEDADVAVMEELLRQRVHLEKERRYITKSAAFAAKTAASNHAKLRSENTALLEDINAMRRQQKSSELDVKKLVERVERLEKRMRSRGVDPGPGIVLGSGRAVGFVPRKKAAGGLSDGGAEPTAARQAPAEKEPTPPFGGRTPSEADDDRDFPLDDAAEGGVVVRSERATSPWTTVDPPAETYLGGGYRSTAASRPATAGGRPAASPRPRSVEFAHSAPVRPGAAAVAAVASRPTSRSAIGGGGHVAGIGSTRALNELIAMERGRVDALLTQLAENEREMSSQHSEIARLRAMVSPKPEDAAGTASRRVPGSTGAPWAADARGDTGRPLRPLTASSLGRKTTKGDRPLTAIPAASRDRRVSAGQSAANAGAANRGLTHGTSANSSAATGAVFGGSRRVAVVPTAPTRPSSGRLARFLDP